MADVAGSFMDNTVNPFAASTASTAFGPGTSSIFATTLANSQQSAPPTTPPTVSNFSPAVGAPLSSTDQISFDVTDQPLGVFRRIMLIADFPYLHIREVIHDGDAFGPSYSSALNTRVAITNGFRYTIVRVSGWPASPTIAPYVVDAEGFENV